MNFQAREPTHAPAIEQELKKEAAFWRQFNGQLSLAAYRQCIKLTGIRGDAIGKYPGDRVEIPYTYFVPAKKFTADCVAPYLSATESRKEYIDRRLLRERRRKLDPRGRKLDAPLYYYDVYVEKEGAERWLKSLKSALPKRPQSHPVSARDLSKDFRDHVAQLGRVPSRDEARVWGKKKYGGRVTFSQIETVQKIEAEKKPLRVGRKPQQSA
jgi:hypothetical protein